MTEPTSVLGKRETCIVGADTETPCPYPATEPVSRWGAQDRTPRLCAYHTATEPLVEEHDDLGLGLELLKEWEETAREHANRPLLDLLLGARLAFESRRDFVEGVLEDLEAAEKTLFRR